MIQGLSTSALVVAPLPHLSIGSVIWLVLSYEVVTVLSLSLYPSAENICVQSGSVYHPTNRYPVLVPVGTLIVPSYDIRKFIAWDSEPQSRVESFSAFGWRNTRYWIWRHLAYTIMPSKGILVNVYSCVHALSMYQPSNTYPSYVGV